MAPELCITYGAWFSIMLSVLYLVSRRKKDLFLQDFFTQGYIPPSHVVNNLYIQIFCPIIYSINC